MTYEMKNVHRKRALEIYLIALLLGISVMIIPPVEGGNPIIGWGEWSAWSDCCELSTSRERTVRFRRPVTPTGVAYKCYLGNAQCIQFTDCVCGNHAKDEAETVTASGHIFTKKHGTPMGKKITTLLRHIRRSKRNTYDYPNLPQDLNYEWDNYHYNYPDPPPPPPPPPPPASNQNTRQFAFQHDNYQYGNDNTYNQEYHGTGLNGNNHYDNYDYGNQVYQYLDNNNQQYDYGTNDWGMTNDYPHSNEVGQNFNSPYGTGGNTYPASGTNDDQTHAAFGVERLETGYNRHPIQNVYDEYYDQHQQEALNGFGEYDHNEEEIPEQTVERLQSSQELILQEIRTLNSKLEESQNVMSRFTNEVTNLEETALSRSQAGF